MLLSRVFDFDGVFAGATPELSLGTLPAMPRPHTAHGSAPSVGLRSYKPALLAVKAIEAARRPGRSHFAAACVALLLGAMHAPARAADGIDVTVPSSSMPDLQVFAATDNPPPLSSDGLSGFLADWQATVAQARATQPRWATPLVTTTGLLLNRVRFDLDLQHSGNGTNTSVVDGGKGIDLIVGDNSEVQFAAPPYYIRSGVPGTGKKNKGAIQPIDGFNDWAFFRFKQRLASSPENEGDYALSALLQLQAPAGVARLTNSAWEYVPTLAFGKGWGAFDIQASIGGVVPASDANIIGYQVQSNVAIQYRLYDVFTPELEVNWTYYANGQRGGLNQVYLTPGLVIGRLTLPGGLKFTIGAGYQVAVAPDYIRKPQTPAYENAWIFTTRLNF